MNGSRTKGKCDKEEILCLPEDSIDVAAWRESEEEAGMVIALCSDILSMLFNCTKVHCLGLSKGTLRLILK